MKSGRIDRSVSVARFEFDLATPFFEQLLAVFEKLGTSPLTENELERLDRQQGIYGLYRGDVLVYIGKANRSLPKRLTNHRIKLSGRLNISLSEIRFKGIYLAKTWVPLAPEAMMIEHFRKQNLCEWNGNGFGPHDPGRNRETTNKPPEGFDSQYPINDGWRCETVEHGNYDTNELLQKIKGALPFCLRYETDSPKKWRQGSVKYNKKVMEVPRSSMPVSELVGLIARQLGPTWQATKFPSHIILYEEHRRYVFGDVL